MNGFGRRAATIPAASSMAVADLVSGPKRTARVLGQFPAAIYLGVDAVAPAAVVAIVRADGVRLPNAVVVRSADWPERSASGDITVGEHELSSRHWRIRVGRWWDPRPRLAPVAAGTLHERLAALDHRMQRHHSDLVDIRDEVARLCRAAEGLDAAGAMQAAALLVGRGVGLTPAGDDVLAGLLAAIRLVRIVDTERGPVNRFAARLGERVLELACDRTSALSASLLRHAIQGEVARPMADFLQTLTQTDSDEAALADSAVGLGGIGHSSGRDLLTGVQVGMSALLRAAAQEGC